MGIKLFAVKAYVRFCRWRQVRRTRLAFGIKGQRFSVPRQGKDPVEVYLYRPAGAVDGPLPLILNVHGGAWVFNDALSLDTQSQTLADAAGALVVNINYQKADRHPFPYPQQEIADTAMYFLDSGAVDGGKIALMGYSAGAHLCIGAAMMLRDAGIPISCQVLCYPFTDFTFGQGTQTEIKAELDKIEFLDRVFFSELPRTHPLCSPGQADLTGLPPATVVTCGVDNLQVQGAELVRRLEDAGVEVAHLHYGRAVHGFLECNYPETPKDASKSPEQDELCRACTAELCRSLLNRWNR